MARPKYTFYRRVITSDEPKLSFKAQLELILKAFISRQFLSKLLAKISIVGLLLSLTLPSASTALFSDIEATHHNQMATSSLDLDFSSVGDDFTPQSLMPGQSASQSVLVGKLGRLDFSYSQQISLADDSPPLCQHLNLKTWYYYYDDLGELQTDLKYSGLLSDFVLNLDSSDPDLINSNTNPYYPNDDYQEHQHWYFYEIALPDNANPSLGSSACSFDIIAKAWQPELEFGLGFWDQETLSFSISTATWAQVSGVKFNDLNGNGIRDDDEPGLAHWTIYAARQFDQFDVPATGEMINSQALESGTNYLIRATGTYSAGDNITADAKYSVRPPSTDWTDSVQNYESYGPELLDLQINSSSPDWGVSSSDHEYWISYEGNNQPLSFSIYDIYYPNNSGSLTVTIFEPVITSTTDDSGYYQIDFSSLEGEIIIAEQPQSGWKQTYPDKGIYSLETSKFYTNKDFGNQAVAPTPDLEKIVINEVYRHSDNRQDWVELYNPSGVPVHLNNWSIEDGDTMDILPEVTLAAKQFAVIVTSQADSNLVYKINQTGAFVLPITNAYIGSALNADGDLLRLRNSHGDIIDQLSWGNNQTVFEMDNIISGHSIARNPLGLDTDSATDWGDNPTPNPGTNPHSHIQVSINQEDNHLILGFTNATGFDLVKYALIYDHLVGPSLVNEAITGQKSKLASQDVLILPAFYFGTCSGLEGKVCLPHQQLSNIQIDLEYLLETKSLGNSQIIYNWQK